MTLLLVYFGECTIRVIVLLEYLDHAFSIYGGLLFYNSFFIFFDMGSFLCLVHLHNSFLQAVCVILAETLDFFKINCTIFTKVELSFITLLSLIQSIL